MLLQRGEQQRRGHGDRAHEPARLVQVRDLEPVAEVPRKMSAERKGDLIAKKINYNGSGIFVPESVPEVVGDGDGEEELEAVEDAATQVQVLDLSQQGGEVAYMVVKLRSSLRIGLE